MSACVEEKVERQRRPDWLKIKLPGNGSYGAVNQTMRRGKLHTVCEEARCPNLGECWGNGTATFMILGDTCTRSCGFCAVKTGRPTELDLAEPDRVAEAIAEMRLNYVVITSVNRDELADGGAGIFGATIRSVREKLPECYVEVLIPDFKGSLPALQKIVDARPDVLAHNMETVARRYSVVRPQARYDQSLEVLARCKSAGLITKSGIMVGIGEEPVEVLQLMRDLREAACDLMTIGQYLQPTREHLPVARYVHPNEFAMYQAEGLKLGFKHVESGPLVRSSYHAEKAVRLIHELKAQA